MNLQILIKQTAKSKTNEFNVVIAPLIVGAFTSLGIEVPLPVILGGYALVNFILRTWFTTKSISEK